MHSYVREDAHPRDLFLTRKGPSTAAVISVALLIAGMVNVGVGIGHPMGLAILVVATANVVFRYWFVRRARGRATLMVPAGLKSTLDAAEKAWLSMPVELRADTQPILTAAYQATQLPSGAYEQLATRARLLKDFARESEQWRAKTALAALGTYDVDAGTAMLVELRKIRENGAPR